MHLVPVPALADNYIWLLHDDKGNALVVDPGVAKPVETALSERKLTLRAILVTHHHYDHVDGIEELLKHHDVPVYSPHDPRIASTSHRVGDKDILELPEPSVRFCVTAVPGHTTTHVVYHGEGILFCGDALFSMGCGRILEGTPGQMLASLDSIAKLPEDTLVCCAHEYTEVNARFANTVDPTNSALAIRIKSVSLLRADGRPTLPVPLSVEQATNPFLRVDSEGVIAWCERHGANGDRIARFAALRASKDTFSG